MSTDIRPPPGWTRLAPILGTAWTWAKGAAAPDSLSPSTEDLDAAPYYARKNALQFLKTGRVAEFNAAHRDARARSSAFRLSLSTVTDGAEVEAAWAGLLEQVWGKRGVNLANMAYAGDMNAYIRLAGIAYIRGITLREDLVAAIQPKDSIPGPLSFAWTDMDGVDLSDADLRRTDFTWAGLERAMLARTDAREVNFHYADLRDTDFEGANVEGADFTGADLSGSNITAAQLAGAKIDSSTVLPHEFGRSRLRPLHALPAPAKS